MPDDRCAPGPRGDEAELFRNYNPVLLRKVGRAVRASHDIIEDACAFAWAQFLVWQPDRDGSWQGWLFRTAQREAWALAATDREVVQMRFEPDDPRQPDVAEGSDRRAVRERLREVLGAFGELSDGDRWLVARRAEGYRYEEIAELTGGTYTSVNRGLSRATAIMREQLATRDEAFRPRSARAQRLADLERNPPLWLRRWIGDPPRPNRRVGGETALLAWRRAALALDDYRRDYDPDLTLQAAPRQEGSAARARALATAAVRRLRAAREPARDLDRER